MGSETDDWRRVRFYGAHDLAAGQYAERVVLLVEAFDVAEAPAHIVDALELHNVQAYLEHDLFPPGYPQDRQAAAKAKIPGIRSAVARFFSAVDEESCASTIRNIGFSYHTDLLDLLGRSKAYDRCAAATMLRVLDETGVRLRELLGCRRLVAAYDTFLRDLLMRSPENAEHLIQKYFASGRGSDVYLPSSLTPADTRNLLERYVDSPDANLNFISLIEFATPSPETGVDARLKLRARRRGAQLTTKLLQGENGFTTGAAVEISDEQEEPATARIDETDGHIVTYTYSRRWLDEASDNASILNNFLHLFEFAGLDVLLTLPSYPADLGVLERVMGVPGKRHYQTGIAFRTADTCSLLQTHLYLDYLQSKERNLEDVVRWFFRDYLKEQFQASNFDFRPSSVGATDLERVRHLFVEMESAINQYRLWVEDREIDHELLTIASNPVAFKQIPSLLQGKYIYPVENSDVALVLDALFSDQSMLTYISEDLRGRNAAELLLRNHVRYDQFLSHQRPLVDRLIALNILEQTDGFVTIENAEQFLILRSLHSTGASSYFHLSKWGRAEADAMADRGWTVRKGSLLSELEADYFSYYLNNAEFGNGPALRNKYLHGSQGDGVGGEAHYRDYVTALKLMIALVIKINDDFCLQAAERHNDDQ